MPENPFSTLYRVQPATDASGQLSRIQTIKQDLPPGTLTNIQTNANAALFNGATRFLIQTGEPVVGQDSTGGMRVALPKKAAIYDYTKLGTPLADTCIIYSTVDPSHYIKFDEFTITADQPIKIVRTLPVRATKGTVKEWTALDDVSVSIEFKLFENNELPTKQVKMIQRMLADNAPLEIQSEYLLSYGVEYIAIERFESRQVAGSPWVYECEIQGYSTQLIDLLGVG